MSARSLAELPTSEFMALGQGTGDAEPLGFAATEPRLARPATTPTQRSTADAPPSTARRAKQALAVGALIAAAAATYAVTRTPTDDTTAQTGQTAAGWPAGSAAPIVEPTVEPSALPEASSSTSVSAVAVSRSVGPIGRTRIKAGVAPQSAIFVSAFDLTHEPGDAGATLQRAQDRCERKGLSLCTEAEWTMGCEAVPDLGQEESWTLTPTDDGVVTRGGTGCDARGAASPKDASETRIGVCCSRVVGTSTSGTNAAFLTTTASKLLSYEEALNTGNGPRFLAMSAPEVDFHGKTIAGDELTKSVLWVSRTSSLHLDSCRVGIADRRNDKDEVERTWSAECIGLQTTPTKAARIYRRVTFGDDGLLEAVREPRPPTPFD